MQLILAGMCMALAIAAETQHDHLLMVYWLMVEAYWLMNWATRKGKKQ